MVKNMDKGQQIAAGGAVAALIATFLPWYSVSGPFGGFSFNGLDFGFGWFGLVLFLGAAGLTVAPALGKSVDQDQIKGEQIALLLAGLGGVMWIYRLISSPFGVDRGIGLFLAVAAGAAVIAGIVVQMKAKGVAMPNADTFNAAKSAVSSGNNDSAPQPGQAPQEF